MVRELFTQAADLEAKELKVSVQFIQVYLERVYDLLTAEDSADSTSSAASPTAPTSPYYSPSSRAQAPPTSRTAASAGGKLQLREDKKSGVYIDGAQVRF